MASSEGLLQCIKNLFTFSITCMGTLSTKSQAKGIGIPHALCSWEPQGVAVEVVLKACFARSLQGFPVLKTWTSGFLGPSALSQG